MYIKLVYLQLDIKLVQYTAVYKTGTTMMLYIKLVYYKVYKDTYTLQLYINWYNYTAVYKTGTITIRLYIKLVYYTVAYNTGKTIVLYKTGILYSQI